MNVEIKCTNNGLLKVWFYPTEDDVVENSSGVSLGQQHCEIHLPENWTLDSVHPDVLALAISLIIHPFCGKEIVLTRPVSADFHNLFKNVTKKEILPVNNKIIPRKASVSSVPGLSYSGGVDSNAALAIMPENTVLFFLDRIIPKGTKSLYKKDAAYFACETLKDSGREVHMIKTDLEYVRNPVGFPVDVANAIPALLLSDYVGIDSIAFGTIMEAGYRIGHEKFENYALKTHYKRWGSLFSFVDIPFNQVTIGLSEVGTSKIVLQSPYNYIAQSCMRGEVGNPCMNCFKCFRKRMLDATLKNELNDDLISKLFSIKKIHGYITKAPVSLENVFSYITSRYHGSSDIMNSFKRKTRGGHDNFFWLEKWYSPSEQFIPNKYRGVIKHNIGKFLETMSKDEEKIVEGWDLSKILNTTQYKQNHDDFVKSLSNPDIYLKRDRGNGFWNKLFKFLK